MRGERVEQRDSGLFSFIIIQCSANNTGISCCLLGNFREFLINSAVLLKIGADIPENSNKIRAGRNSRENLFRKRLIIVVAQLPAGQAHFCEFAEI